MLSLEEILRGVLREFYQLSQDCMSSALSCLVDFVFVLLLLCVVCVIVVIEVLAVVYATIKLSVTGLRSCHLLWRV
jgi:hypothetical protein